MLPRPQNSTMNRRVCIRIIFVNKIEKSFFHFRYYNFLEMTLVTLSWKQENEATDSYRFVETMALNVTSNYGSFAASRNKISVTSNQGIVIKIELDQFNTGQMAYVVSLAFKSKYDVNMIFNFLQGLHNSYSNRIDLSKGTKLRD